MAGLNPGLPCHRRLFMEPLMIRQSSRVFTHILSDTFIVWYLNVYAVKRMCLGLFQNLLISTLGIAYVSRNTKKEKYMLSMIVQFKHIILQYFVAGRLENISLLYSIFFKEIKTPWLFVLIYSFCSIFMSLYCMYSGCAHRLITRFASGISS